MSMLDSIFRSIERNYGSIDTDQKNHVCTRLMEMANKLKEEGKTNVYLNDAMIVATQAMEDYNKKAASQPYDYDGFINNLTSIK